jgi:hypothetical protein
LYPYYFVADNSAARLREGPVYGLCAPIEKLKEINYSLMPIVTQLKSTPFFRTYKINLERECPFWVQERLCSNNKCSVCECEDPEIPLFWREQKTRDESLITNAGVQKGAEMGSLSTDQFFSQAQLTEECDEETQADLTCPENDKEWCIEEKESDLGINEADYIIVNLVEN